jgi:hypothetical protein
MADKVVETQVLCVTHQDEGACFDGFRLNHAINNYWQKSGEGWRQLDDHQNCYREVQQPR